MQFYFRSIKYLIYSLNKIYSYSKILFYKILYLNQINFLKYNNVQFGKRTHIELENYSANLNIGEKFVCRNDVNLRVSNGTLKIGNNVFINNFTSITCMQSIEIGDNCLFGESVKIYDHDHKFSLESLILNQGFKSCEVKIGNNVWVGSNVVILRGVTIGNNVVIGAGCIIKENIDNDSLVTKDNKNQISIIKYKRDIYL